MNPEEQSSYTQPDSINDIDAISLSEETDIQETLSRIIYEKKSIILQEIIKKSPYTEMSELFKRVLIKVVMTFKFESYDYVEVPCSSVGLVVGVKGTTIKYIQDMTDTKILSPSKDMRPIFMIFGETENVHHAKSAISNYVDTKVMPDVMKKNSWFGDKLLSKFKKKSKPVEKIEFFEDKIYNEYTNMTQQENSNLYNGMSLDIDWLQGNTFDDFAPKQRRAFQWKTKKPVNSINRKFSEQVEKSIELLIEESNGPKLGIRRLFSNIDYHKWKEHKENLINRPLTRNTTDESRDDTPFCMMCFSDDSFVQLLPCGNGPFCNICSTKILEGDKMCPICQSKVENIETWTEQLD